MTQDKESSRGVVAELRALLDKATPGPWVVGAMVPAGQEGAKIVPREDGDSVVDVCDCGFDSDNPKADAALIAALRNAAPDLLDIIERFAKSDPIGYFPQGGGWSCAVCDCPCQKSKPIIHDAACPWVDARALMGMP